MAQTTTERQTWLLALEAANQDLVRGHPHALSIAQARQLRLEAWCFYSSKAGTPYRQELASEFAGYWQRQQSRAAALVSLLQAWHAAGIRTVAIKGLAMAYAVYPHAAARFCSDSDVLLHPDDAQRARSLQVPGWFVVDRLAHWGDERRPFMLWHAAAGHAVDAHVSLLSQFGFPEASCRHFCEQLMSRADLSFELTAGSSRVTVKTPQPADLLMVLAANRAWGDRWHHKPHDYTDMALAIERYGLTHDALLQRATELGVRSTWLNFLEHCNPFDRRFDLAATRFSPLLRWRKSLCTAPGGLPPRLRLSLVRAWRAGPALWRVAQTVPTFLGVLRRLRSQPAPADASACVAGDKRLGPRTAWPIWQVEQAARWVCHLLRPLERRAGAGPCVVQSLTLFRLMQRHGHACEWRLGYRDVPGSAPVGHAWVEAHDPYAMGVDQHNHNRSFKVVYRRTSAAATAMENT